MNTAKFVDEDKTGFKIVNLSLSALSIDNSLKNT